ncbi:MAG: AAA family ATPase [Opitutaceae bacterium]|nr:AAA family ATPase [Opitutaceae bacterium]
MIAAVRFKNFKALRSAAVRLESFNLIIGPNGSGKTSLIQALLSLRTLALSVDQPREGRTARAGGPEIDYQFSPPFADFTVRMRCVAEMVCDVLRVEHPSGPAGDAKWADLRSRLRRIRAFLFDHHAMAAPAAVKEGGELSSNAGNLAAVLAARREKTPAAYVRLVEEFRRIMPEFAELSFREAGPGHVELILKDSQYGDLIPADSLSQGVLNLLAVLTLSFAPEPPSIVCLEEADRGIHPRLLREVRDALYRLSNPRDFEEPRGPVQVIVTTHSPYLLDLFRDHPEEVVLANKEGRTATFERLADRPDLLELMKEANLGDLWYSGILGGVPGEE